MMGCGKTFSLPGDLLTGVCGQGPWRCADCVEIVSRVGCNACPGKDELIAALRAKLALWAEYHEFAAEADKPAYLSATLHGWKCPQEDVDKGADYRKRLGIGEGDAPCG